MTDTSKTTTTSALPAAATTKDIRAINSACHEYAYNEAWRALNGSSWPVATGATANEQGKLFQSCREANFNDVSDVEDIPNLVAQGLIDKKHLKAVQR